MLMNKVILSGLLLTGAGTDLAWRRIPNALILAGLGCFLASGGWLLYRGEGAALAGCLCAGALGFAIHLIPWLFKAMGAGDVKLALIVGLLTGWTDWLGYLSVYCVILLAGSGVLLLLGKNKPGAIPLAPFMAASWFLYFGFL